jgi:hypothetical protein
MEDQHWAVLFRKGPELAPNTKYMWNMDGSVSADTLRSLGLEFVKRYDNLSIEQIYTIAEEVGSHKGPQNTLIQKIKEILHPD